MERSKSTLLGTGSFDYLCFSLSLIVDWRSSDGGEPLRDVVVAAASQSPDPAGWVVQAIPSRDQRRRYGYANRTCGEPVDSRRAGGRDPIPRNQNLPYHPARAQSLPRQPAARQEVTRSSQSCSDQEVTLSRSLTEPVWHMSDYKATRLDTWASK